MSTEKEAARPRACKCCGSETLESALSESVSEYVSQAYLPFEVDGLCNIVREALTGARQLTCGNCGFVHFEGVAADAQFYEQLSYSRFKYFPTTRAEWDLIGGKCLSDDDTIVDVGCGNSGFKSRVKKGRYIGVDFATHARSNNIEYVSADLNESFELPSAGTVCSFQVMEHVKNPREFLLNLLRTPNVQRVFVTVPNSINYRNRRAFDFLNHPPHHLSQFTYQSLLELGKCHDAFAYKVHYIEKINVFRRFARIRAQSGMQTALSEFAHVTDFFDESYSAESLLLEMTRR